MTWVKIDDGFADHPKVAPLSNEAFRVFVHGLCYCSRHLTDGRIPDAVTKIIAPKKAVRELEEAGLWERNGSGMLVRSYLEYQPSSEAILKKRAAESARKRRGRGEEL